MPKRSDKWDDHSLLSRRAALVLLGGGGLLGITAAGAYDQVELRRAFGIGVSNDGALVGIVDQGPVKRNSRDPMVELTNNTAGSVSYTLTLNDCSDGTLYDNGGGSGCSVTVTLSAGNSTIIDIQASATGAISYAIEADGGSFSVTTTSTVEAQSGNVVGAIRIQKPSRDQEFTAVTPRGNGGNVFEVRSVDVRDDDGDDDLVEVAYEVREGGANGTIVGSKTVTLAPTGRYNPSGNPSEEIVPNAGYTIQSGQQYTLTVTGTDADGNVETSTVGDTA